MTTSGKVKPCPTRSETAGLRKGFTTGSCATAAAKAAAYALILERRVDSVEISLPSGDTAVFSIRDIDFTEDWARAVVVKDAGDDPDVTNGAEIGAFVKFYTKAYGVVVSGGRGVGMVTKPGLAVPVGQPAINPVPMKMIKDELMAVLKETDCPLGLEAVVFVPNGEELAKKTLNHRLGIVGGLSILGTTGIVEPISTSAWTDTISLAMDVARAVGVRHAVLTPGRTSETAAMSIFNELPEEAFIQMGDHVGFALSEARRKGFAEVTIVGQFGKLVKMAMGADRTHANDSRLELAGVSAIAREAGLKEEAVRAIGSANTAREAFHIARKRGGKEFFRLVCDKVASTAASHLGNRIFFECVMVDYERNRV